MDLTVITHATVLVHANDVRLLFDPLFGLAGKMAGMVEPAVPPQEVTDVDAVFVTHGHPDHVDPGFFEMLDPETPVVVPEGIEWPEGMTAPPGGLRTLKPWQSVTFGHAEVTCVPARHQGVSCGYVVDAEGRVLYVAGDTHYDDSMKEIASRWRVDLALLPERPRPDLPIMDAEEAARAVETLHPSTVVLYHLGSRQPTPAGLQASDEYLRTLSENADGTRVVVAQDGRTIAV